MLSHIFNGLSLRTALTTFPLDSDTTIHAYYLSPLGQFPDSCTSSTSFDLAEPYSAHGS